ncbi:MAG TPA: CDP-alcohol phosphatidyltransferase family protein [Desulfobacterales bacterium]
MTNSLRDSALARGYFHLIAKHLMPKIEVLDLSPNQCTLIGLTLALVVPLGFWLHPLCGFFLMGISGMADSIDGLLARNTGRTSHFGAFLDSSLDRLSDVAYLFGFWILFWGSESLIGATALLWLGMLLTFMISYVKARAETLGAACQSGLLERGRRMILLLLWALLIGILPGIREQVLWTGLLVYLLLTGATVVQRFFEIHRRFHNQPFPPP